MKALTANRLADGEVVFWNGGQWVEQFGDAELFAPDDPAGEAAEAHAKTLITLVVEPYLIDLTQSEGLWAPVSYRERIRALGPSNLPHGKQTAGGPAIAALLNAHGAARSTGRVDLIKRK
ncbi:MAG TPA: DUF2849 domain-containing protein [Phenylobacterium sp.]